VMKFYIEIACLVLIVANGWRYG